MIAVERVPAPAGAPAGASYFKCARLSAVMTTTSCAQRWSAATSTSPCSGCAIGHQHHASTSPTSSPFLKQKERLRECLRCGRTHLRVIQRDGICVSCWNRQHEWRRGRNAKGLQPVKFQPLDVFTVATETTEGAAAVVHYAAVEARHAAEAVGVIATRLPEGTRLSTARPGDTCWSGQHNRFVIACPACGHAGLLERTSRGRLHHHCPACAGAPCGPGWALARPSAPVTLLTAAVLATWLELTGESAPAQWASTQFGCETCGSAVLQARSTAEGHVEARCPACGAAHAH